VFVPRTRAWTVQELQDAVAASTNLSDVLRRLGLRAAGGNFRSVGAWIQRLEIPTDHFRKGGGRPAAQVPLEDILVAGSRYNRGRLKERLYDGGIKERRCELCGQGELWRGTRIALILDHVNGVADDNRLENVRIVCPNCAATLDTHCGRKLRREQQPCERCGEPFQANYATQRFCSYACFNAGPRSYRGVPRPERRRVERPPLEHRLAVVSAAGPPARGRSSGVSHTAILMWSLAPERAAERTARPPEHAGDDPADEKEAA
jgi:hypothetical protein